MRGYWNGNTLKFNRHWQKGSGFTIPEYTWSGLNSSYWEWSDTTNTGRVVLITYINFKPTTPAFQIINALSKCHVIWYVALYDENNKFVSLASVEDIPRDDASYKISKTPAVFYDYIYNISGITHSVSGGETATGAANAMDKSVLSGGIGITEGRILTTQYNEYISGIPYYPDAHTLFPVLLDTTKENIISLSPTGSAEFNFSSPAYYKNETGEDVQAGTVTATINKEKAIKTYGATQLQMKIEAYITLSSKPPKIYSCPNIALVPIITKV